MKNNVFNKITTQVLPFKKFYKACKSFYYDKTIKRLDMFYNKTGVVDCKNQINGIEVSDLKQMFSKIDWELFYNGIPTTIHGDLQFDNILVQTAVNDKFEKFKLLDWRQNFGGLIESGDLYYDLSKLYGGMVLSYQLIKDGKFSFEMSGDNVYYNYMIKNDLVEAKEMYEEFIVNSGYDLRKIKLMTGLIFLNMSPLHHDPFDHFLYFLGKSMISRNISN